MSLTPGNADPYPYPGTNVLRNLRGITESTLLERFEARRSHLRIAELIERPVAGTFNIAHLKAIRPELPSARMAFKTSRMPL